MKLLTMILVGLAAGLLGALCGVGGGIIMVPAFTSLLKMEQKTAVATSLAAIVISSFVATIANARTPLIDWRVVLICGFSAAIASYFGSELMKSLSNPQLTKIFAVVLIAVGIKTLLFS